MQRSLHYKQNEQQLEIDSNYHVAERCRNSKFYGLCITASAIYKLNSLRRKQHLYREYGTLCPKLPLPVVWSNWHAGNSVMHIYIVTVDSVWLVLTWVIIHMYTILVCNRSQTPTQPAIFSWMGNRVTRFRFLLHSGSPFPFSSPPLTSHSTPFP